MTDLTPAQPRQAKQGTFLRSPDQIVTDNRAADMRSLGWTYQQIGDQLGVTRQAAHQAVQRAIRDIPKEGAEEVLAIELGKIDRLERYYHQVLGKTHYKVGNNGKVVMWEEEIRDDNGKVTRRIVPLTDEGPKMDAANGILKVQAQRAKLLGLNAPTLTRGEMLVYDIEGDTARMIEAQTKALEAMGLNDRVDEFRNYFVAALRIGGFTVGDPDAIEAVVVSESDV